MAFRQDTMWEQFLKPIFSLVLDREYLKELRYHTIAWEKESDRLSSPQIEYPDYYRLSNFHGVQEGYLSANAAVTYDAITQYVLPPNETWVRQELINSIAGRPKRILDLGCGTGSTTLMLKQAFPAAETIGLDLSPYMLVMAEFKAQKAGLEVQWMHGLAEKTTFAASSFDLVTASLLFHETPPEISRLVLRECFRLLKPGGEVIILDGNQQALRQTDWLTSVFEEPYMQNYAQGSVDAWMGAANFVAVRTKDFWWLHQVTRGMKPIPVSEQNSEPFWDSTTIPVPIG